MAAPPGIGSYASSASIARARADAERDLKLKYKIEERSGSFGGRSFVVQMGVALTDAEAALRSSYGFYERLEVGERFKDTKGVSIIGDIELKQLLGGASEFKFASIQRADDFVIVVERELGKIKEQINGTASGVAKLGKQFEIDF
jgi:hypothetical protein